MIVKISNIKSTYRLKHEHSPFVDSHDLEYKYTYGAAGEEKKKKKKKTLK